MKFSINLFLLAVYILIPSVECADSYDSWAETRTIDGPPVLAQYNGTLTCEEPPFCAMIYYMDDSWSADDYLAYVSLNCSDTRVLHHTIAFNMTSPSRLDDVYNPFLHVYHDCGGKFVKERIPLSRVFGNYLKFSHPYRHTLRNSGLEVEVETIVKDNTIFRSEMFKNEKYKQNVTDWLAKKSVRIQYETVQVSYSGTLTCDTGERFCARIQYKEEDLFWDDELAFIPLQCTEGQELHHQITINMTGGDGINDLFYEPRISIFHDCGGVVKCAKFPLPEVSMCNSTASFSYTQNITDCGWNAQTSLLDKNSGQ